MAQPLPLAIHLGFQWLLDPDGNPATADAPQVVNNSWSYGSPGCNLEFQNDLKSLRLVGILPVFAAGNYGPNSSTSVSPANYPEAFAVGAVDNSGALQTYSSRGPSACGESSSIYPELVAPGANITTTDLYGLYTQAQWYIHVSSACFWCAGIADQRFSGTLHRITSCSSDEYSR